MLRTVYNTTVASSASWIPLIEIQLCVFSICISSSNGGAIFCNHNTQMNITDCSFIGCEASGNRGGGIYFATGKGFDARSVCFYKCKSYFGQALSITLEALSCISNLNFVSYSLCSDDINIIRFHSVEISGSKSTFSNVNGSKNYLEKWGTGAACSGADNMIKFCDFCDSIGSYIIGYGNPQKTTNGFIDSNNFVNNSRGPSNALGTFDNYIVMRINNCIMKSNTHNVLFFSNNGGSFIISNSVIDIVSGSNYELISNHIGTSNMLSNEFLNTIFCPFHNIKQTPNVIPNNYKYAIVFFLSAAIS